MENVQMSVLVGKTLVRVVVQEVEIVLETQDGEIYKMFHEQDCCESVTVEDVCGDLESLLNTPIVEAEERSQTGNEGYDSQTWTFYHLVTIKGSVTIRWYGTSNGYYSESVSLARVK